jgi:hypothetical protein
MTGMSRRDSGRLEVLNGPVADLAWLAVRNHLQTDVAFGRRPVLGLNGHRGLAA